MKPRERRDEGQQDFFRARLEAILDMGHALVKLALRIDWGFFEKVCGEAYTDGPGSPPLPTRLMVGLEILKYTYDLSDERVCALWLENPLFSIFLR
jgi:IS5 family transposase